MTSSGGRCSTVGEPRDRRGRVGPCSLGGGPVTAPVELPAPAWDHIRTGRPPEPENLAMVADVDVATEGVGGAAARRGSLEAGLLGAGPLEPLLQLHGVTDVAVNGDGSVWLDTGRGLVRADVDLGSPD